ncbi:MAG: hypothetical protein AAFR84_16890 [Pseudomonadota bacterium]
MAEGVVMTDAPTGWSLVWKINAACLRAAAGAGLGWLCWQGGTTPGFEIALFFAPLFGIVAAKHAVIALVQIVRLVLMARRWARFQAQGVSPKADRLVSEADLRKRGLIR